MQKNDHGPVHLCKHADFEKKKKGFLYKVFPTELNEAFIPLATYPVIQTVNTHRPLETRSHAPPMMGCRIVGADDELASAETADPNADDGDAVGSDKCEMLVAAVVAT